jgi:hypothetical protein
MRIKVEKEDDPESRPAKTVEVVSTVSSVSKRKASPALEADDIASSHPQ